VRGLRHIRRTLLQHLLLLLLLLLTNTNIRKEDCCGDVVRRTSIKGLISFLLAGESDRLPPLTVMC
jgi:hypothetical protein